MVRSLLPQWISHQAWFHCIAFRPPPRGGLDPTTILPYTTGLSPYLKFGCVSIRRFYWAVQDVYDKHPGHTQPPHRPRPILTGCPHADRRHFEGIGAAL